MQITSINSNITNLYTNQRYLSEKKELSYSPVFRAEIPMETYRKYLRQQLDLKEITIPQPLSNIYKNGIMALRKLGDFTISEYKTLSQEEINCIKEVANNHIYNNASWIFYDKAFIKNLHYHDIVATALKDKMNQHFGEGNYIVIPIGRSLSSIGKCLGYKIGEENVKPLPLSNTRRFVFFEECESEDFQALREYLDSIGLSKKEIETSEKKYIFMDFCATGWSFLGEKTLLRSDKMYGYLPNIKFIDMIHFLKGAKLEQPTDEFYPCNCTFIDDLEHMLFNSRFKPYSIVKECHRLSETKNSLMKPEDYKFDARIFLFKLLDTEMNKFS